MKRLILIALTSVLCVAAANVTRAQEINPKLKIPKNVPVGLPDLVVSSVSYNSDADGIVKSITVTVKNTCGAPAAYSHVQISISDKEGKHLLAMTNLVKPLKGGESETWTTTNVPYRLPSSSPVLVTADYHNHVKEDVEGNNWSKLNPNSSPFPDGPKHCKPKN